VPDSIPGFWFYHAGHPDNVYSWVLYGTMHDKKQLSFAQSIASMNEPIDMDIEAVRSEALRKLGRNIVNFSKIEGGLKYLLSISQVEVVEGTFFEQFRKNQDRVSNQTLGKLVREFHKNVVVDASQSEIATDSFDFKIAFYAKVIRNNPDFFESRKLALSAIVLERNKLIHQELALLDTSCIEDYRKLISRLDEQNPRLLDHLEELRRIGESVVNGLEVCDNFLKSPEFLQYIQSSQTDV
jgi:hypothetical protein